MRIKLEKFESYFKDTVGKIIDEIKYQKELSNSEVYL